jgi:RimJ/RimL family protein N-acetyltransferase
MNIKTMEAAANSDNAASNRILQKIGMQLKEQYLEDGVFWNWYQLENTNFK